MLPGQGAQSTIDALDGLGRIVLTLHVQYARARNCGQLQRMHNQCCLRVLPETRDPAGEPAEHVVRRGLAPPQSWRYVARLHGQDNGVRLKAIERTLRVEDLLSVSVELAHVGFQRDAGGVRSSLQKRD